MNRITERQVTEKRIAVAPVTEIHWNSLDPSGLNGFVRFRVQDELYHDGEFVKYDNPRDLKVRLEDIVSRTFTIPDGQGGTVDLPAIAVMAGIKAAFELFYEEAAQAASAEGSSVDNGGSTP